MPAAGFSQCGLPMVLYPALNFTIATINPSHGYWARIFDFGNNTDTNMFLTWRASSNNRPRFAIKVNGSGAAATAGSGFTLSAMRYHIAITKVGNTARMYLNGELAAINSNMRSVKGYGNNHQQLDRKIPIFCNHLNRAYMIMH